MKLEYYNSARRDFRSYALLFVGLIFIGANTTVDPARNCDESGQECAPWLIPVAGCLGIIASLAGATLLIKNSRWGSTLNLERGQLIWWGTRITNTTHSLLLSEVAHIKVRLVSDGNDNIFFYDQQGVLISVPKDEVFPPPYENWAKDITAHFPHIRIEIENT